MLLRKAMIQDVKGIHKLLLNNPAEEGLVLPRSFNQIYNQLRDFFVLVDKESGEISGCCALNISWDNLAEVRSLVVSRSLRGKGHGRKLIEACLSEALTLGIYRVFVLTNSMGFFAKMGFSDCSKDNLPQKVWADCINCPMFPDCEEVAMIMNLEE